MSRVEKILKNVLSGSSDVNISFIALCHVKQVRGIILKYKMEV